MYVLNTVNKCNYLKLIFIFGIAALFLAVCSKSSFLYPLNDWVDSNCFFTVARSLVNGEVLYKDIYEQKGPLLYFIHSVAYLLVPNSFAGVYIVEVISFGMFLFFAYKCSLLYVGSEKISVFIVPSLAVAILTSSSFSHGDSVEELSLVFLMYSLYTVMKALKSNVFLRKKEIILNGICVACVFWMKYTILGFYIGLIIFVMIWYVAGNKVKELWDVITHFLIGFFIITIPVLLYFLITHSIYDLFETYFYNNLFIYSVKSETNKIVMILNAMKNTMFSNKALFFFVLVGFIDFAINRKKEFVALLISFVGLSIGTYWGGVTYIYYGLIFSVFSTFGIISVLKIISKNVHLGKRIRYTILLSVVCCGMLGVCFILSQNVYLMQYEQEEMPQYKFAKKMNEVKDASMLNYGFLDGGFYLAADILPNCKFFCTLNIPLKEMKEEQTSYIEEGKGDFVVTRDLRLEETEIDSSKYRCVGQESFYFDGKNYVYYLYEHVKHL